MMTHVRVGKSILLAIILFITFVQCSRKTSDKNKPPVQLPVNNVIADTIIYDVLITNPNPDDTWTSQCLKNLEREAFIDQVFQAIYDGNLQPFDYYENKPISPRKLKRLEKSEELIRENIGKIQFTERWIYDPDSFFMKKEVISMVLGEHLYSNEGEVRGYKPVFMVKLK